MNQRMADNENIIDRGEADITAFDLLNINPNAATPFTEKLEKTYALEDEKTQGLARFITGLPLETAGIVKSALIERGPATFLQETFGKGEEGQVTVSFDDVANDEDLLTYLNHMEHTVQNNEVNELNDFAKDLEKKYDLMPIKDNLVILDDNELIKYEKLLTKAQDPGSFENPSSYKKDYDKRTITFDSSMFPKVPFEPDVKIIDKEKGEVGFPYLGKYGFNDEGEFVKKFSSAFKPFDESEEGLGQYSEYIPEFLKSWQNYSMPEYSPDPALFRDPGWQMGALVAGGRGIAPIAKGIAKGGKNIFKGIGNYLEKRKMKNEKKLIEPYIQGIRKDVAKMDQQTSSLVDEFPFLAKDDEFLELEALKIQEQDRLNELLNNAPWSR
tara:strand:+ start:27 stop:1178 length:1152 start_codon:yes stop_codon:yes gene_type:complete